jgi:hypothetical protein
MRNTQPEQRFSAVPPIADFLGGWRITSADGGLRFGFVGCSIPNPTLCEFALVSVSIKFEFFQTGKSNISKQIKFEDFSNWLGLQTNLRL